MSVVGNWRRNKRNKFSRKWIINFHFPKDEFVVFIFEQDNASIHAICIMRMLAYDRSSRMLDWLDHSRDSGSIGRVWRTVAKYIGGYTFLRYDRCDEWNQK